MATISFYGQGASAIDNLSGSGVGFFGTSFGSSVEVGGWNSTTWITDGNGSNQGPQLHNVKYENAASGALDSASPIHVKNFPNYMAPICISMTHDTEIRTQNAKLYIYDRTSINNDPSGVICRVYESLHTSTSQVGLLGSGLDNWTYVHGSAVILDMADSPGISGNYAGDGTGSTHVSTEHSWYAFLTSSPSSIGEKNKFGLFFSCEYL